MSTVHSLHCPNCGAPLDYNGEDASINCPYCGTQVLVPESLRTRPEGEQAAQPFWTMTKDLGQAFAGMGSIQSLAQIARLVKSGDTEAAAQLYQKTFGGLPEHADEVIQRMQNGQVVELTHVVDGQPTTTTIESSHSINLSPQEARQVAGATVAAASGVSCLAVLVGAVIVLATVIPVLFALVQPDMPLHQLWLRINPTALGHLTLAFGQEGTGSGLLQDPRGIAVDGEGNIYVANYDDGRIQRFSNAGEFQGMWNIGVKKYVTRLVVDRQGVVYVVFDGEIWRYDGATGDSLGAIQDPEDHNFDDIVLAPDGGLLALSHSNLLRYSASGKLTLNTPLTIQTDTGETSVDGDLAVDGLGNVFILNGSDDEVLKFTPDGRFLSRFGSSGDEAGQLSSPDAIAIDGQGRVYVTDFKGIQVFGADGRYLGKMDVDGYAFALAFDNQWRLYAATNKPRVLRYEIK
jgi:DNA-directed RNA polymerase subunit RPC12/RpoP